MKKLLTLLYSFVLIGTDHLLIAQTVDKNATIETSNLLGNLKKQINKGIIFGHQDDLAYGVGWKYEKDRSDVKDVTGEYPGLYGWELAGLEKDSKINIDSVPFDKMREFIRQGYERGGVITLSWHLDHPLTGKNAWDTTHGGVAAVLPGGVAHEMYKTWLDKLSVFALSLRGARGELIPVIFRPFHELTGNWFWWTQNTCTPDEFKRLWLFTFDYLTKEKGIHNFIYMYNTAGNFNTEAQFLERYPGDDFVDMISFDAYQYNDPQKDSSFVTQLKKQVALLETISTEKNKIAALGETGYEAIPYADWWTKTLWKAIGEARLSYVLLWRNHGQQPNGHMHYYVPFKGDISAEDFKKFYLLDKVFFEKKIKKQHLYNQP